MPSITMSRADIIRELSAKYAKELPDENVENVKGYMQVETNTLICMDTQNQPMTIERQAQVYFEQAQVSLLKGNPKQEDKRKAEYCRIASQAIRQMIQQKKV